MRKNILLIAFFINTTFLSFSQTKVYIGESIKLPYANFVSFQTKENWDFALSLTSKKIFHNFKINFILGKIGTNGISSKLNSLGFSSTITPFSSLPTETQKLSATFSGTSNFNKGINYFIELSFLNNKNKMTEYLIETFYNKEEKYLIIANRFIINLNKKNKLSFTYAANLFNYEKYINNSWFSKEKYYKNGISLASIFQVGIQTKNFSSVNSININESPYSEFKKSYKSENTLKINHTIINFGLFFNPEKTFTSSQTSINEQLQIKFGINQTKLKINLKDKKDKPRLIKYGITILNQIENQNEIKMVVGISTVSDKNNFLINANLTECGKYNFFCKNEELKNYFKLNLTKIGISIKDSISLRLGKLSIGTNINYEVENKSLTEKLYSTYNLNLKKTFNLYSSIGISTELTQKNLKFKNVKTSINISEKFEYKWFTFTGKINFTF